MTLKQFSSNCSMVLPSYKMRNNMLGILWKSFYVQKKPNWFNYYDGFCLQQHNRRYWGTHSRGDGHWGDVNKLWGENMNQPNARAVWHNNMPTDRAKDDKGHFDPSGGLLSPSTSVHNAAIDSIMEKMNGCREYVEARYKQLASSQVLVNKM